MREDRLQLVQRIFEEVLRCDPSARGTCLDEACGRDAELRGEVEALLRHHAESAEFFRERAPRATDRGEDPPERAPLRLVILSSQVYRDAGRAESRATRRSERSRPAGILACPSRYLSSVGSRLEVGLDGGSTGRS